MPAAHDLAIPVPHEWIADFCRRWRIRRLSFFGSVVRPDFGPGSDVDVLVEFRADAHIGWNIVTAQQELSEVLGRRVDLRTPPELSRWMVKDVLREAVVEYVEES
jgi:predicted nucleotidyltransferase